MLYRTGFSTPVFGLRREIDKLFEDTFGRGGEGMNPWSPAVDVRESDNELRLELELPGIRPEEVEITADNGILTIRGEKRSERKEGEEGSRYHVVERSYGNFMRSFQLPQGLDEEKIEADYDNGILSIHIPKTALPQPKKIQISKQSGQRQMGSGQAQNGGDQKNRQQQQVTSRAGGSNGGSTEGNASKSTSNRSRETAGTR